MSKLHPTITTICVSITLLFFHAINKLFAPLIHEMPAYSLAITNVLASTGFYLLIFNFTIWVYDKYFVELLFREEAISGEWFYKLDIKNRLDEPRYGNCLITRNTGHIHLSGIHFNPEIQDFTSSFESTEAILKEHELKLFYKSSHHEKEATERTGVYSLQLGGNPTSHIWGVWSDIFPSANSGKITLFPRTRETDELLKRLGYPVHLLNTPKEMMNAIKNKPITIRNDDLPTKTRLFLFRHAESVKNIEDRHGDSNDHWKLTKLGRRSSQNLGRAIKIPSNIPVYCSNAQASKETASLFCEENKTIPIEQPNLRSIHFGVVSGMTRKEIQKNYPDIHTQLESYHEGKLHPKDYRIPGAESNSQFEIRIKSELLQIINQHTTENIVLFIHRSTITMILNIIGGLPILTDDKEYLRYDLPHLSLTVIEFDKLKQIGRVLEVGMDYKKSISISSLTNINK